MTYYLSFRSDMRSGSVIDPKLYTGAPGSSSLKAVPQILYANLFRNRDVVFVTHGFNVNGARGINALGRFDAALAATGAELCIAMLWPGDWWIPAINYPFEASDAVDCGQRLARFCKKELGAATSLSFISHSLGGRLVLEAVKRLDGQRAKLLCMTAAAVDDDCLQKQYAKAVEKCDRIVNLASKADRVLHYAYPVGDFASDLFGDDDSPFIGALGRYGPQPPKIANVGGREIPKVAEYDHGNYLPPSEDVPAQDSKEKWKAATEFMIRAFRGQTQVWPPAP
jgi:hypothetical protein